MSQVLKKVLLTVTAMILPSLAAAQDQVIQQLSGVGSQGNTVVIEHKEGSNAWNTVYQGHLSGCLMNEYASFAHHHSLSTFHHQLKGDKFAFGCSNGYVFIGTTGETPEKIKIPSPGLSSLGSWYNSPIYLAYSEAFNQKYGKNWLFAAQHGALFIIDVDNTALVSVEGWANVHHLPMGARGEWTGVDNTKPMTGLDIYQDDDGTFHVLGIMERNLTRKESHYSKALMQSVALPNGEPGDHWDNFEDEAINKKGDGILQYADTGFKTSATGEHQVVGETSLKGDFSALNVDPSTRSMLLRGHHSNLVVVRYPVNTPVSLHYVGLWGKAVSAKIEDGYEPQLLSDGKAKTFRVTSALGDVSVLRPERENYKKRYMHHHMLSMKKGIIYSAEADFEGFGRYVFQCDTDLASGESWKAPAWVKPKNCEWTRATPDFPLPNELENLDYPLSDLTYYHSFTTRIVRKARDEL